MQKIIQLQQVEVNEMQRILFMPNDQNECDYFEVISPIL
jgi:hypothetical protein